MPAFARPLVMLDAGTTLNAASPASTALFAGEALHWTSQQEAHLAAGKTISMAAIGSAGVFVQQGGIKTIAQAGPVSVQAHNGKLDWTAQEAVTVTSLGDSIEILAQTRITLGGGQTSIVLDGQDITLTMPGLLDIKGATKSFVGPGGPPFASAALPDSRLKRFDQQIRAVNESTGESIAQMPYRLTTASGAVYYGVTDAEGKTERIATVAAERLDVQWGVRKPDAGI